MLKVLQLIPTLDRSGAEKQMVLLAQGLPRARFRVEVAALTRLGPLEADLRGAGVPVTALGKRHEFHTYPTADHAFFNDARPEVYDAAAAADAWTRTLTFFRSELGR